MLFFSAGVTGGLAAEAVYTFPIVSGANAGALALLAAWAAPKLVSARAGEYYDGRSAGHWRDRGSTAGDAIRPPGGQLAGGSHRCGAWSDTRVSA